MSGGQDRLFPGAPRPRATPAVPGRTKAVAMPQTVDFKTPGLRENLVRVKQRLGPEGGWGPEELASGLPTVGLGRGVFRVETAAVAAGVLLCALRAGIVTPGANDA